MNSLSHNLQLLAALVHVDRLGFDHPSQALGAVLEHEDWATRWDVDPDRTEDERIAFNALAQWRAERVRNTTNRKAL